MLLVLALFIKLDVAEQRCKGSGGCLNGGKLIIGFLTMTALLALCALLITLLTACIAGCGCFLASLFLLLALLLTLLANLIASCLLFINDSLSLFGMLLDESFLPAEADTLLSGINGEDLAAYDVADLELIFNLSETLD